MDVLIPQKNENAGFTSSQAKVLVSQMQEFGMSVVTHAEPDKTVGALQSLVTQIKVQQVQSDLKNQLEQMGLRQNANLQEMQSDLKGQFA